MASLSSRATQPKDITAMRFTQMAGIHILLVFAILPKGLQATHWTGPLHDGDVIYACNGGRITLPWQYQLEPGDAISNIEWFYHGHSEEVIAALNHGHFITYPAFANRVSQTPTNNAGIIIDDVITADSGKYTVTVIGSDDFGQYFDLRHSVIVQISDQLMTEDGHLHVTQSPEAVTDSSSGQLAIQLQCGHFTFLGKPPHDIEWITPDGLVHNSSSFSNGHFNLLLTTPVQGGTYTCRVPRQHLGDFCLHEDSDGREEASVSVDKVDTRLTLLENENEQLRRRLTETDGNVEKLQEAASRQVSFHARYLADNTPPNGTPLVVDLAMNNHGLAYNTSTGYFTAPFSGTYFFIATTISNSSGSVALVDLYINDTIVIDGADRPTAGDQSHLTTVQGTFHLSPGEKVWLRSNGDVYNSLFTSFSGFLVSTDLF